MLPREGQELRELGMKTVLEVEGRSGLRRPTKALLHPMNACNLRLTGRAGEKGLQVASECLLFPDYFMERSHLIIILDLPFYSHRRAPISQRLCVLFPVVSCAALSPGTKNSPNHSFLL